MKKIIILLAISFSLFIFTNVFANSEPTTCEKFSGKFEGRLSDQRIGGTLFSVNSTQWGKSHAGQLFYDFDGSTHKILPLMNEGACVDNSDKSASIKGWIGRVPSYSIHGKCPSVAGKTITINVRIPKEGTPITIYDAQLVACDGKVVENVSGELRKS